MGRQPPHSEHLVCMEGLIIIKIPTAGGHLSPYATRVILSFGVGQGSGLFGGNKWPGGFHVGALWREIEAIPPPRLGPLIVVCVAHLSSITLTFSFGLFNFLLLIWPKTVNMAVSRDTHACIYVCMYVCDACKPCMFIHVMSDGLMVMENIG